MTMMLEVAALNLGVALVCGAVIGSERQVRQRMAGLRTNALVALGAAAFVIFSQLVPNEVSPTRVAAQVVSGIGFLGAGIIFREGFNVHGLNTAATLWCSAAVGLIAGIGAWDYALVLTGLVVFINLGLRPLVKFLKKHTKAGVPVMAVSHITVRVPVSAESTARALILEAISKIGLALSELRTAPSDDGTLLVIDLSLTGGSIGDEAVEKLIHRLAAEPGFSTVRSHGAEDV